MWKMKMFLFIFFFSLLCFILSYFAMNRFSIQLYIF